LLFARYKLVKNALPWSGTYSCKLLVSSSR
jgi:hypothetical protein